MPLPCRFPCPRGATAACLLTLALLGGAPLEAAPLLATVSGGLISGDLGGTSFANAPYSVTASYDPGGVQSGTLAGFPATYVGAIPTITIDTGSAPLSGTLQPFAGFSWHLFSIAIAESVSRSGFAPIDGSLTVTNAFDIEAAGPRNTLLAPEAFGGDSAANAPATWQTTAGPLTITASTDAAGTFAIVPEPTRPVGLAVAVLAMCALRRRWWT